MDHTLHVIFKAIFGTIVGVAVITMGLHISNYSKLNEVTKKYAEVVATTGGFTNSQYEHMIDEFRELGIDVNKAEIKIVAEGTDGSDISDSAMNVTPLEDKNENNPVYCPRGSIITLTVRSGKSPLRVVFKALGQDFDMAGVTSKKSFMSERVK